MNIYIQEFTIILKNKSSLNLRFDKIVCLASHALNRTMSVSHILGYSTTTLLTAKGQKKFYTP